MKKFIRKNYVKKKAMSQTIDHLNGRIKLYSSVEIQEKKKFTIIHTKVLALFFKRKLSHFN